jgi:hypothetical protein
MAASKKKKTAGSRAGGRPSVARSKGTKAKRAPRAGKPRATAPKARPRAAAGAGVQKRTHGQVAHREVTVAQGRGMTAASASPGRAEGERTSAGSTATGSTVARDATAHATVQVSEPKPTLPRPKTATGESAARGAPPALPTPIATFTI